MAGLWHCLWQDIIDKEALNMAQKLLEGLNEEQIAKVKACKNQEELLSLAKEEGVELSEDQLAAVAGGGCCSDSTRIPIVCPDCGNRNVDDLTILGNQNERYFDCTCHKCGRKWRLYC